MEEEYSEEHESTRPSGLAGWFSSESLIDRVGSTMHSAGAAITEAVEGTGDKMKKGVSRLNSWAASNIIGRAFAFKQRRARLSVELRAGTVTFLMVAYVLAVNPDILASSGGTCNAQELCPPEMYKRLGNSCLFSAENEATLDCLAQLKMDLTTATAATALISCFIMGFFANLPYALAPGMGINIYVAYQVVGQGLLTYQQAMVAIFLEGFIFIILSMTGVRAGIIRYMPKNISSASSVGIGLLLAFTGLRNLGIIVFDPNTLLTLGACPESNREYVFVSTVAGNFNESPENSTANALDSVYTSSDVQQGAYDVYACSGAVLRSATAWLGIAGGVMMALLYAWRVKGSLFIGIAFVTIISWIPGHSASYLGAGSPIPGGQYRMDLFSQVVAVPSISSTGLAWDWSAVGTGHFWVSLLTFLYIDMLDCTGILLAMAHVLDDCMRLDAEDEGSLEVYQRFLNKEKEFAGQQWAFLSDGLGIISGSMMGITPVTVYMESAAGIEDGGRTGIVAIAVSFFFFISLFFSPIFSSIPPYATGPALVLIGVLLIAHVDQIKWDDPLESVPAFLTMIMIVFTFSVAYGVISGLFAYVVLHLPYWIKDYSLIAYNKYKEKFRPRIESEDEQQPNGGDAPAQPRRALSTGSSRYLRKRVHRKTFGEENFRNTMTDEYNFNHITIRSNSGGVNHVIELRPGESSPVPIRGGIARSVSNASIYDPSRSYSVYEGSLPRGGSWGTMPGGQSPGTSAAGQWMPPRPGGLPRTASIGAGASYQSNAAGVGKEPTLRMMTRSKTFADFETAAQEARTRHDLTSAAGGSYSKPQPVSGASGGSSFRLFPEISSAPETAKVLGADEEAPKPFSLFGEPLLDINLDDDDEDEKPVENTANQAVEEDKTSRKDEAAALGTLPSQQVSLDFSTTTLSPDDHGRHPSVDLSMFVKRDTSTAFSNPLLSSSSLGVGSAGSGGTGGSGGITRGSTATNSGAVGDGMGARTNSGLDLHSSISLGSSSLSKQLATAALAASQQQQQHAGGSGSQPAVRVEGWPGEIDGPVSSTKQSNDIPSNKRPVKEEEGGGTVTIGPAIGGGEGSKNQAASDAPPTTSKPTLKRVESAAAIRLRSLFSSDDDLSQKDSPEKKPAEPSSKTVSIPQRKPISVLRSTSAPNMEPSLGLSPFDQAASGSRDYESVLSPRAQAAAAALNLPETIISGVVALSDSGGGSSSRGGSSKETRKK